MNFDPTDDPTVISIEDIDKFFKDLVDGKYDLKIKQCFKCSKDFYPNYDDIVCDECYFDRFPKEEVKKFYRSFFE